MLYKREHWQRTTIVTLIIFTFFSCRGDLLAQIVKSERDQRESLATFAANLGLDAQTVAAPISREERSELVRVRREEAIARLKEQVCQPVSPAEIQEIQSEFKAIKDSYLPDRIAGLAGVLRDCEQRLDRASKADQDGNGSLVTPITLEVYAKAMEVGAEDVREYASLLEERMSKSGTPEEIAERTRSFNNVLESETIGLGYAFRSAASSSKGSKKAVSVSLVEDLKNRVESARERLRDEINSSLPERGKLGKAQLEETEILTYPFAGGSGSGGGGGSGGSGGDESSMMNKVSNILNGGGQSDGGGGSSGDPVDYGTGELSLDQYDLTVPSVGDVAGVVRRYRSQNENMGPFGYGWFHNYSLSLEVATNGNVILTNDDGRKFTFPKIGEGVYGPPEEMEATIEPDGDGFLLHTGGKFNLRFNSLGVLEWRGDNYGNRLNLNYDVNGHLDEVVSATGEMILDFDSNSEGLITQLTDRGGRVVQYEYDVDGNLTVVTNPDGGQWWFSYYEDHNLSVITDPEGNSTMNFYDDSDRVMSQIDPLGNEEVFSYDFINDSTVFTDKNGYDRRMVQDEEGRVVDALDAEGNRVTYTYDDRGRKTSMTDEEGRTTTYEYGSDCGSCGVTRMLEPDGTETLMEYGPYGLTKKTVKSPTGEIVVTTQTYNDKGELSSYTTDSGETKNLEYNASGQVVRQTSSSGQDVRFTYDKTGVPTGQKHVLADADGNPVEVNDRLLVNDSGLPIGHEDGAGHGYTAVTSPSGLPLEISSPGQDPIHAGYSKSGLINSVTSSNGISTQFEYDRLNRGTVIVTPGGGRRATGYDPVGNVVSMTDEEGNANRYDFNGNRQRIRITDAGGNRTDMLYCGLGTEPVGVVGPSGDSSLIERDERDRITAITNDLGATTRFEYGSPYNDGPVSMVDPLGNTTSYEYDGEGRLVKVVDAEGKQTVYEYTGSQREPSKVVDAEGRQWLSAFDALGRLIRETDPLGNVKKYYYDGAGNKIREVDAEGRQSTFTYDVRNRLIAAALPNGATESYTYDGAVLIAEGNSETRSVHEYDEAGRRSKTTTYPLGKTITYTYTAGGRAQTKTVPGVGTTTYNYDPVGNVVAIDYPSEGTVRYEYDEAGRRTRIFYPNGAYAVYTYDLIGQIASLIHYDPDGVPLTGQTFTYDKAGNIKEIRDHTGKRSAFSYDAVYRLTEVRENDVKTEAFTYDTVGNVTSHYLDGVETAYQYDDADRLIQESRPGEVVDYAYDKVGNLIKKTAPGGITEYKYDGRNRLEEVTPPVGDAVSYAYNTDGINVARTEGAGRTDYLLDGNSVHSDYSGGNLDSFYLQGAGLDELHGVSQPGKKATYLHQDRQNSVTAGSGEFGQSTGQRQYRAYGSTRASTGLSTRYGYTGRELDGSTGLMNFRSRWYSPDVGRFISPDLARGELGSPLSLNRYAYGHDNPILNNDPLGYGMFADMLGIGYKMGVSIAISVLSCFSPIAAVILGFYDVYYSMLASLMDLLFDYDGVAGNDCACNLLVVMFLLATVFVIIAGATWTSCWNELWKKFVGALITQAATKIGEYITKKLGGALAKGIYGTLVRILLAYAGILKGASLGTNTFKFLMAPELLLGFCMLRR